VISIKPWPLGGHITIALAAVGFEVATLAPRGSPVRFIKAAKKHFRLRTLFLQASIKRAIAAWSPDLLICADDWAVRQLHRLYHRVSKSPNSIQLADLVKTSLGDPSGFKTATTTTDLLLMAQAEKLRCPRTIVVCNNSTTERALRDAEYPILVKADGHTGGGGVRLIANQNDAPSAIGEILLPIGMPRRLKRLARKFFYSRVLKTLDSWPSRACVQEFVYGRPANRAVLCWNGRVLAGISVEAIETINKFGAASVVRIIDNLEMETASAVLIERLGLSGFVGFDFMLDEDGKAFLLELNPRLTPIAHLPNGTSDLVAALSKQMMKVIPSCRLVLTPKKLALFPQEIERDRSSPYLSSTYHDVPWSEPAFVAACSPD
jgi:hypothetical protein